ncbi:chitin disaccharide deacetylase [Escherichia sp. E4742]|uniref:chitin disaccharide deacetylase n=1 Tax=Escherichia sp. E4742 TaxID=2044467 RepID=UPI0010814FD9|nr:chitin disaccharide deacetylase [Escherichia sp. E4742]QCT88982.1 chitin disaccharide deacetylase [Escherichia sp. E4742]TGB58037.1 chitin disaccharide deacetylase [Escherichia sp. E4742]TLJ08213.1 chitin disaccharide deacetylase [Escherichia sp. E4742]
MQRLLIVNADDFGLSPAINYGIIDAHRCGVVTSTTAMMTADAIEHAVKVSADLPSLAVGLHFVLSYGNPLTVMSSLQRDGKLGKWIWDVARDGLLAQQEVENELEAQYQRFVALFCRKPTHIDSHHHVHFIPQVWPIVSRFAQQKGLPVRFDPEAAAPHDIGRENIISTEGFTAHFYADNVLQAEFLRMLDESAERGEKAFELMCHPGFVDSIVQQSAYCFERLTEHEVLTSEALRWEIAERGYRLGAFRDL